MNEKQIYCIIDCEYPEDALYVSLTEAQAKAIKNFIEWANITDNYSIKEGSIIPIEW